MKSLGESRMLRCGEALTAKWVAYLHLFAFDLAVEAKM
jgi:hypothetical protein